MCLEKVYLELHFDFEKMICLSFLLIFHLGKICPEKKSNAENSSSDTQLWDTCDIFFFSGNCAKLTVR